VKYRGQGRSYIAQIQYDRLSVTLGFATLAANLRLSPIGESGNNGEKMGDSTSWP